MSSTVIKKIAPVLPSLRGFTLIEILLVLGILAVVAVISIPAYMDHVQRADEATAISDILTIELEIERFYTINLRYPDDLTGITSKQDPWGNAYQFLNLANVKGNGKVRKDHSLVPINSDYDLYSMGKDGASQSPLTAKASRDDIIRANNGGFVGRAADY